MAKIDEIKEALNSLRIWLSLTVGIIVVVSGGLISGILGSDPNIGIKLKYT